MELRPYQQYTIETILADFKREGNSIACLATGCLAKDTPIPMWDGSFKSIQNIKSGDVVISYDQYLDKPVPGVVENMFRTSLNPKPMLSFIYDNETITTTYDHPFFDGEGFYPIYQLAWREMEESQRIQLKLLCEQYGQTFNNKTIRGKYSCCNETCARCERLLANNDERSYCESSQNCSGELVIKSTETSSGKSFKRQERRQQSRESGVVYSKIQCLDWTQDWKNKNTNTPEKQYFRAIEKKENSRILSEIYRWAKSFRKENTLQNSTKEIPASHKRNTYQNLYKGFTVKIAEPYYSICMQKAPYTYCIGKRNHFITHNSGKSVIIAELARLSNQPLLIFVPSKELLIQNYNKLVEFVGSSDEIGIFSASADSKEIKRITIATILSCYKCPEMFTHFNNVIIDETDLLDPTSDTTLYMDFLNAIGVQKVVGLTATPYRLVQSYSRDSELVTSIKVLPRIHGKRDSAFWKRIIVNIPTRVLIEEGYLQPIEYFDNSRLKHQGIPTNKGKSDFNLKEYEEMILPDEENILDAIVRLGKISHTVLVFCLSVEQAERFAAVVTNSAVVSATTPKKKRDEIIAKFKAGEIKTVFNVSCLTVGFDHPQLDAAVVIRPTRSLRLWNQMVGRLMRKHPQKTTARLVDFSGTYHSLGKAEDIEVAIRDGKWDIISQKNGREKRWHGVELYRIKPVSDYL